MGELAGQVISEIIGPRASPDPLMALADRVLGKKTNRRYLDSLGRTITRRRPRRRNRDRRLHMLHPGGHIPGRHVIFDAPAHIDPFPFPPFGMPPMHRDPLLFGGQGHLSSRDRHIPRIPGVPPNAHSPQKNPLDYGKAKHDPLTSDPHARDIRTDTRKVITTQKNLHDYGKSDINTPKGKHIDPIVDPKSPLDYGGSIDHAQRNPAQHEMVPTKHISQKNPLDYGKPISSVHGDLGPPTHPVGPIDKNPLDYGKPIVDIHGDIGPPTHPIGPIDKNPLDYGKPGIGPQTHPIGPLDKNPLDYGKPVVDSHGDIGPPTHPIRPIDKNPLDYGKPIADSHGDIHPPTHPIGPIEKNPLDYGKPIIDRHADIGPPTHPIRPIDKNPLDYGKPVVERHADIGPPTHPIRPIKKNPLDYGKPIIDPRAEIGPPTHPIRPIDKHPLDYGKPVLDPRADIGPPTHPIRPIDKNPLDYSKPIIDPHADIGPPTHPIRPIDKNPLDYGKPVLDPHADIGPPTHPIRPIDKNPLDYGKPIVDPHADIGPPTHPIRPIDKNPLDYGKPIVDPHADIGPPTHPIRPIDKNPLDYGKPIIDPHADIGPPTHPIRPIDKNPLDYGKPVLDPHADIGPPTHPIRPIDKNPLDNGKPIIDPHADIGPPTHPIRPIDKNPLDYGKPVLDPHADIGPPTHPIRPIDKNPLGYGKPVLDPHADIGPPTHPIRPIDKNPLDYGKPVADSHGDLHQPTHPIRPIVKNPLDYGKPIIDRHADIGPPTHPIRPIDKNPLDYGKPVVERHADIGPPTHPIRPIDKNPLDYGKPIVDLHADIGPPSHPIGPIDKKLLDYRKPIVDIHGDIGSPTHPMGPIDKNPLDYGKPIADPHGDIGPPILPGSMDPLITEKNPLDYGKPIVDAHGDIDPPTHPIGIVGPILAEKNPLDYGSPVNRPIVDPRISEQLPHREIIHSIKIDKSARDYGRSLLKGIKPKTRHNEPIRDTSILLDPESGPLPIVSSQKNPLDYGKPSQKVPGGDIPISRDVPELIDPILHSDHEPIRHGRQPSGYGDTRDGPLPSGNHQPDILPDVLLPNTQVDKSARDYGRSLLKDIKRKTGPIHPASVPIVQPPHEVGLSPVISRKNPQEYGKDVHRPDILTDIQHKISRESTLVDKNPAGYGGPRDGPIPGDHIMDVVDPMDIGNINSHVDADLGPISHGKNPSGYGGPGGGSVIDRPVVRPEILPPVNVDKSARDYGRSLLKNIKRNTDLVDPLRDPIMPSPHGIGPLAEISQKNPLEYGEKVPSSDIPFDPPHGLSPLDNPIRLPHKNPLDYGKPHSDVIRDSHIVPETHGAILHEQKNPLEYGKVKPIVQSHNSHIDAAIPPDSVPFRKLDRNANKKKSARDYGRSLLNNIKRKPPHHETPITHHRDPVLEDKHPVPDMPRKNPLEYGKDVPINDIPIDLQHDINPVESFPSGYVDPDKGPILDVGDPAGSIPDGTGSFDIPVSNNVDPIHEAIDPIKRPPGYGDTGGVGHVPDVLDPLGASSPGTHPEEILHSQPKSSYDAPRADIIPSDHVPVELHPQDTLHATDHAVPGYDGAAVLQNIHADAVDPNLHTPAIHNPVPDTPHISADTQVSNNGGSALSSDQQAYLESILGRPITQDILNQVQGTPEHRDPIPLA